MIEITLHDDAFDELRSAASEAAQEIDDDSFAIGDAIYRRYKYIPTAEDIARRKEFEATPLGQITKKMFERSAQSVAKHILERNEFVEFVNSDAKNNWQWPETVFPTTLKIRLPD